MAGSNNGRIIFGTILIFFGAFMIFDNFFFIPFQISRFIFSWPMILIIAGVIIIVNSENTTFGAILLTLGLLFSFSKYYHFNVIGLVIDFWPAALIIIGIIFILTSMKSGKQEEKLSNGGDPAISSGQDSIDEFLLFSSGTKKYKSQNFKGGKITALLSGGEIDLTGCKLAGNNYILDILVIFGGVEIFVPKGWNVIVKTTSIFGGFDDSRKLTQENTTDENKTIVIKGFVMFGGGEIKS